MTLILCIIVVVCVRQMIRCFRRAMAKTSAIAEESLFWILTKHAIACTVASEAARWAAELPQKLVSHIRHV